MLKKLIFSDTMSLVFGQVLSILLGYLLIVYLARSFAPEIYGAYAFSLSIISWLELILTIGFHNYIISFDVINNKSKIKKIISIQILSATTLSLLVLSYLFFFYSDGNRKIYWIIVCAVLDFIPFALYSTNVAIINEMKKYRYQSALIVTYSFLKLVFMIVLSEVFLSIEIAVVGMALSSFLTFYISCKSLSKIFWACPSKPCGTPYRDDLRNIAISVLIVIAIGVLINIDFWCLKANNPNDMTLIGNYGVVTNFSRAFYFIVSVIFYKYYVLLKSYPSILESMKVWGVIKNLLTVIFLFFAYAIAIYTILDFIILLFFGNAYVDSAAIGQNILPYQGAFFVSIFMIQSFFYLQSKVTVLSILILNIFIFYLLMQLLYPHYELNSIKYTHGALIIINTFFFLTLLIFSRTITQIPTTKGTNNE